MRQPRWVGSLILLFGLALLVFATIWFRQMRAATRNSRLAQNWPTAKASVSWVGSELGSGKYTVRFRYVVDGNYFLSEDKIDRNIDGGAALRTPDGQSVNVYVGAPVTCYYDPANPSQATLSPHTSFGDSIKVLRPMGIAIFAVYCLFEGVRRVRAKPVSANVQL
jgi:hypothetical protein